MDEALREERDLQRSVDRSAWGMPPEAPRPMPPQPLAHFDESSRRPRGVRSSWWPRALVLGGAAGLAALLTNEMRLALSVGRLTILAAVVLALFAVNVSWISLPCVTSLAGLLRSAGRRRRGKPASAPLSTRTAVVMPTYNEDPARVAAALDAMAHDIVAQGEGGSFDVFLLSDSTNGDIALAEEEVVWALRRRLDDDIRLYYRRRADNAGHKAGNVREFCERWGGAYDHLLVLDADSLMDGATIVTLARRMEADPDVGLIQTLPRLHTGSTLLARAQQFAGTFYGTLLGQGFAWWVAREATSWGHNAILRTEAFMTAAGLPVLPGDPPFGGPILSHDFVEAALIRRRGWSVIIADDLEGSYEECPPSIVDLSARERRWCQGNLQHARVLAAKGLHWVSRLHLAAGIMSYLSSPLWLLFVLAALALGVQYDLAHQQYFARVPTLFPLWPRIDPERAVRLFGLTMATLLGPKVLGMLAVAASPRRLRESGGPLLLALGFLLEVLLSALIAPIMALIQCGLVADVLRGRDSGWRRQRREGGGLPWSQVLRRHRWHVLGGAALAVAAFEVSWQMLAWLSPAVAGMVLAPLLSKLTGSPEVGRWIERVGLLRTPQEARVPAIGRAAEACVPLYRDAIARAPDLIRVVGDPEILERHLALTDRAPPRPNGTVDAVEAIAEKKIRDATHAREAIASLTPEERARVQGQPALLRLLTGFPID